MTDEQKIDREVYRTNLAANLVKELFTIIDKDKAEHGQDFADELTLSILCSMIGTLVFRSLHLPPSPPQPGRKPVTHYAVIKQALQNVVGTAFTTAFQSTDPKSTLDFVCQVSKVIEPPSKLSN